MITGAGSGIGKAVAITLAKAGARIAVVGHTDVELQETVQLLGGEEQGHFGLAADVGKEGEMQAIFSAVAARWESVDILVASAGINGTWAPLGELTVEEWDHTMATNLRGTFLTLKLALPLLRSKGGSVVIISSINGTRVFSNSGATAYSCSKAGQVALTKMAALELAKDRIRVNVVCPGAIETKIEDSTERRNTDDLHLPVLFPQGSVPLTGGVSGSAEQVAHLVWFLASDLSSHITGTEIYIEGAQSLLQG